MVYFTKQRVTMHLKRVTTCASFPGSVQSPIVPLALSRLQYATVYYTVETAKAWEWEYDCICTGK